MVWLISVCVDTAAAGVFLVPLLWFFWGRGRLSRREWGLTLLLALYLSALFSVVGLPDWETASFSPDLHLLPFTEWAAHPLALGKTFGLNVLLFLPLGVLLPLLWPEFRRGTPTLLAGFGLSLTVEVLQLFSLRLTDTEDLLANTLGTLAGFLLFRLLWQGNKEPPPTRCRPRKACFLLLLLVLAVCLTVQPLVSGAIWTFLLDSPLGAALG
jgi:glycopeptide antibiotics resistance protein